MASSASLSAETVCRYAQVGPAYGGIGQVRPLRPPLVLAVVVLAKQLDLGLRAPLYAASLLTTGVVPWGATLALAAWAAVASFIGAIAAGRYTAPSGR